MSAPTTPLPEQLAAEEFGKPPEGWCRRLYNVIFEADTKAGRTFDIALVIAILLSILVVVLDSVPSINAQHNGTMDGLEWGITLLFTIEYVARLASVRHPIRYATSLFGIIDLLTIRPRIFRCSCRKRRRCSTFASCACCASSGSSS